MKKLIITLLMASPVVGLAYDLNDVQEKFDNYSDELAKVENEVRGRFSEGSKLAQAYETMQEFLKYQEQYLIVELQKLNDEELAKHLDQFFKMPLVVSDFSYTQYFLDKSCKNLATQELYSSLNTEILDPIKDQDKLIKLFHGKKPLSIKCQRVSKRRFKKQEGHRISMDRKTMTLNLRYYRDTSSQRSGYFYGNKRISLDHFPKASDFVKVVLESL